jgi:hypothetical protein
VAASCREYFDLVYKGEGGITVSAVALIACHGTTNETGRQLRRSHEE